MNRNIRIDQRKYIEFDLKMSNSNNYLPAPPLWKDSVKILDSLIYYLACLKITLNLLLLNPLTTRRTITFGSSSWQRRCLPPELLLTVIVSLMLLSLLLLLDDDGTMVSCCCSSNSSLLDNVSNRLRTTSGIPIKPGKK